MLISKSNSLLRDSSRLVKKFLSTWIDGSVRICEVSRVEGEENGRIRSAKATMLTLVNRANRAKATRTKLFRSARRSDAPRTCQRPLGPRAAATAARNEDGYANDRRAP